MPAEDTLTYRVEVDAADLPQQLEQIRNQMDMALGAMAFSAAPSPPEMTAGPMNFMFDAAPQVTPQHMIDSTTQGFLASNQMVTQSEGSGLMSFLNTNVEAFRLGYSKFHGGMERMGLMIPPSPLVSFPPQGVSAYTEQMEHLQGLGYPGGPLFTATGMIQSASDMPGLVSGALGFGYDPNTMPYSRFEFQQVYGEAMGRRTRNFFESNAGLIGGTAVGAAIGAVGGPIGALGGATIGMAFDATMGWAGGRRRQNEQVGEAFRRISQQSNMQRAFTRDEGTDLAESLLGRAETYEGRINQVTRESIQSQLLDFTQEGGFDSVRSAEEFKQTAEGVINNTRKIMQTLRMTQEEATKFMAEMNREGLVSTADISGFALDLKMNAKVAGIDPLEMANFMKQGSEAFRGSAYGMGGGMQMLEEARLSTQQLLQNVPMGRDIIRELGGAQQATMGFAQANANFMQTGMGMIGYNNMMRGGASGDMMAMMSNTYGMTPFDWYRERASMTADVASGDVSQQDIAGMRLDPYLQRYQSAFKMTEGRGMGADDFEGMFHWLTQIGQTESVAEARQLFSTRFQDPGEASDRRIESLNAQLDKLREPEPITLMDTVRAGWGEFTDTITQPFRDLEQGLHDVFDPLGMYFSDKIIGRTRLSQSVGHLQGATQGHIEKSIAARAARGDFTEQEDTFLKQTIIEYQEHLASQGGVLDRSQYNLFGSGDREAKEEQFQERLGTIGATFNEINDTGYAWNAKSGISLLPRGQADPFAPAIANYGTLNANENLQDILTGFEPWTDMELGDLAGVDLSILQERLGEEFIFGKLGADTPLGKKTLQLPTESAKIPWADRDILGIDTLIIAQMMEEGTLTSEGIWKEGISATRGNHNYNPVNISVSSLEQAQRFYGAENVRGIDWRDDAKTSGFVQFTSPFAGYNAARQEVIASIAGGQRDPTTGARTGIPQTINQFLEEQSPASDNNDPRNMASRMVERMFSMTGIFPWPEKVDKVTMERMLAQDPLILQKFAKNDDGTLRKDKDGNYVLNGTIAPPTKTVSGAEFEPGIYFWEGKEGLEKGAYMGDSGWAGKPPPSGADVYGLGEVRFPSDVVGSVAHAERQTADSTAAAAITEYGLDETGTSVSWNKSMVWGTGTLEELTIHDASVEYWNKVAQDKRKKDKRTSQLILASTGVLPSLDDPQQRAVVLSENPEDLRLTPSFSERIGDDYAMYLHHMTDQQKALASQEDKGFLKDYMYTVASTFIGEADMQRQAHLTEFIKTLGGVKDEKTAFTVDAARLGLVNINQETDAAGGLFRHQRAFDLYGVIGSYDVGEIGAHITKIRPDYPEFDEYATAVGAALKENTGDYDNEMLGKLNLAASELHKKGVISAATIAELEIGEVELVRDVLYNADPKGYTDTYTSRAIDESLASHLFGAGGATYLDDMNQAIAGADATQPLAVQALTWKLIGLEKERETKLPPLQEVLDTVGATDAIKALQGTSSWGAAFDKANQQKAEKGWVNDIIGGGLVLLGGAVIGTTGWTGAGGILGAGLISWGGGMLANEVIEATGNVLASKNTSHLAKMMQYMRTMDKTLFMSDEAMEAEYGTSSFEEMEDTKAQQFFIDTLMYNQNPDGTNKIIQNFEILSAAQHNGQNIFNGEVTKHLDNTIAAGYEYIAAFEAYGLASNSELIEDIQMTRGLRAGLMTSKEYIAYDNQQKGDTSTFERTMELRAQLKQEQEDKGLASIRYKASLEILNTATLGVDEELLEKGRWKKGVGGREVRTIMSFDQFLQSADAKLPAGAYAELVEAGEYKPSQVDTYSHAYAADDDVHKDNYANYERYAQIQHKTVIAGKYNISFDDMEEFGMQSLIKNTVQDKKNEETIREKLEDATTRDAVSTSDIAALILNTNRILNSLWDQGNRNSLT